MQPGGLGSHAHVTAFQLCPTTSYFPSMPQFLHLENELVIRGTNDLIRGKRLEQ